MCHLVVMVTVHGLYYSTFCQILLPHAVVYNVYACSFMYACVMCAHLRKMVGSKSSYMYIIRTGHVYWCSCSSIQLCIHTVQVYIYIYIYIYLHLYIYLIYNRYVYYSSTIRVLNTCMQECMACWTNRAPTPSAGSSIAFIA